MICSCFLLFNIYTYDLPDTISRKYIYADGLLIRHSARDWFSLEETLNHDLASSYYIKLPPEMEVEA